MANLLRRQEPSRGMLASRHRDPFGLMEEWLRSDPFAGFGSSWVGREMREFLPQFDVSETDQELTIRADLPGMTEEDVNVNVIGNRLTLSGERKTEEKKEDETYHTIERSYGAFSRTITLPEEVEPDKAKAELKNGVLTVKFPKRPEARPRRIPLQSSG